MRSSDWLGIRGNYKYKYLETPAGMQARGDVRHAMSSTAAAKLQLLSNYLQQDPLQWHLRYASSASRHIGVADVCMPGVHCSAEDLHRVISYSWIMSFGHMVIQER